MKILDPKIYSRFEKSKEQKQLEIYLDESIEYLWDHQEELVRVIAKKIYSSPRSKTDLAIKIFFERILFPNKTKKYTIQELRERILDHLSFMETILSEL